MFHRQAIFDQTAIADIAPLQRFFTDRIDGLHNAAALLGGPRGSRLVDGIVARLGCETAPSRATWRALRELIGLLTLEHVQDDDRDEAAFFAGIDPADPAVEDICLLADQFREALEQAVHDQPPAPHGRVAA